MFKKYIVSLLAVLVSFQTVYAVDLELTQGHNRAIPIAIVDFKNDESTNVSDTIKRDLKYSGAFRLVKYDTNHEPHNALNINYDYWKSLGVNSLVVGDIVKKGNLYSINVQLLDPISKAHILLSREYSVPQKNLNDLAHHISDIVYQQLTGHKGIFSSRIAFVTVNRNDSRNIKYQLNIADYDGRSPRALLVSNQPIMSPAWSPDGKQIAYVSFENKKAEIYIVEVSSGQRQLVTNYPGINGAPSWSPNGKQLAMVLSKSGQPKIYLYDVKAKKLSRLTNGYSIDTEPSFTPNGKGLIFTSNRGGSPQIYKISLASKKVMRLTFNGNYNASGALTPSSKKMVLLHKRDKSFSIALQDLTNGVLTPLTFSKQDESPSLSPNGRMVIYATHQKGKGILRISTLDGKVNFKLPKVEGDMQEPAWSPFLN